MARTLHLNLKKHWFDLIANGEKKEEYRDITNYWTRRLIGDWQNYQTNLPMYRGSYLMPWQTNTITFRNGYSKNAREFVIEWKGIEVDTPNIKWFPSKGDLDKFVFVLKLGEIIEKNF